MAANKDLSPQMEVVRRLENLEGRVAAIEEHTVHNTRINIADHEAFIKSVFGNSRRRAQVFLATDRRRNVSDLCSHLGMLIQNVSADLQRLEGAGLVKLNAVGTNSYWTKTAVAKTIGVAESVIKKFNLSKDGLPKA